MFTFRIPAFAHVLLSLETDTMGEGTIVLSVNGRPEIEIVGSMIELDKVAIQARDLIDVPAAHLDSDMWPEWDEDEDEDYGADDYFADWDVERYEDDLRDAMERWGWL